MYGPNRVKWQANKLIVKCVDHAYVKQITCNHAIDQMDIKCIDQIDNVKCNDLTDNQTGQISSVCTTHT